jgi:hypothetical protein
MNGMFYLNIYRYCTDEIFILNSDKSNPWINRNETMTPLS